MNILLAAKSARRAFRPVAWAMAIVSGALFLLCSIYILAEMLTRDVLGASGGVSNEVSTYVLATGVAWSLAYTLRSGGHVRIDLVFAMLSGRAKNVLDAVATAFMAIFAFALSFYSWQLALTSFEQQSKSLTSLQAPLFIPQSLMAFGFSALMMDALLLLAVQVAWIISARLPDDAITFGDGEI